jgi:undecaprenyl-diphosphatase
MVPAVVVTSSTAALRAGRTSRVHGRYVMASLTLLALVVFERWLLSLHTFPGDAWAARLGMAHKPWLVWASTRLYQQIGRPLVAIGEVMVMLVWLRRTAGRRAAQGLLIGLLASASCGLIKIFCGPTPLWAGLAHHVGTNFPSGVVTFMAASVGYVALVAWRQRHRSIAKVLILAIAGAGPARVLGGQHLLSDVLGGYMLGTAWLLMAYSYLVGPVRAGRRPARRVRPEVLR